MKRTYLGEFEEIVLLLVAAFDGEAYGVGLTHKLNEQTDRSARLSQVHAALHRLEEKGMVASRLGDPTPERGGRRKLLFTVTAYGYRTLQDIKTVRAQLWDDVPATPKLATSL
ncbi:transcriptional regulator, PadR-like family [Fibrella aestuarina BUZ 2]|uniref:Transcriptional regulator, PadR-like family n=1 Tax=Fibrella aestuarina BUZ 2 TaxID=1166018 RepID=I0K254_9BACT|nr:helix-turn-helix transcriptional regulator [Fibrella aestuarina]CCG98207.1 transcriptional regulator, PadR-like family [Fibrella aestuarina BUZ 2]